METEILSIEELKQILQNILDNTLLSHDGDKMEWKFFKEKYDSLLSEHPYLTKKKYKKLFSEFDKKSHSIALCNAIKGWGNGYTTNRDWILTAVKWNIEHGADVNYWNDGFQPIFLALPLCGKGYLDVVEELIRAGADVNIRNYTSNTPLIMACYAGYPEFVKVLVDAGADLDITDKYGSTAEMTIQEPFVEQEENITDWEKMKYPKTLEKVKVPVNQYWKEMRERRNKQIEEIHNILRQKKSELV